MATFSSGVKCLRSFLIRSLRYLNGRTLSPFPTEAGHVLDVEKCSGCGVRCRTLADFLPSDLLFRSVFPTLPVSDSVDQFSARVLFHCGISERNMGKEMSKGARA